MDEKLQRMVQAIKDAIMTEIKGQQLYSHAAATTEDPTARALFQDLADDEDEHVALLEAQYRHLLEEGRIDLSEVHPAELDHGAGHVIDDDFRRSLKRGKFELAVISIGCDLESRAIQYYREQAERAEDPDLKQLFTWLSEWEVGHLDHLKELEQMLQDAYWSDQGFAPM